MKVRTVGIDLAKNVFWFTESTVGERPYCIVSYGAGRWCLS